MVDEQAFALAPAFLAQNLVQIKVTGNNNGTPIVLGITAQTIRPQISGVANHAYTLLSSPELPWPPSQWTPVATNVPATSGNFVILVPDAFDPAPPRRFFRLEAQ